MEEKVFPRPAVAGILEEKYVEARLHADGELNVEQIHQLQDDMAKSRATPLYLVVDPVTEQRVTRAVDRLVQGRTAVVIAHRLSTVERLDEIVVLDAGRIVEHGSQAALRADPTSRYARLLATGASSEVDAALLGPGAER